MLIEEALFSLLGQSSGVTSIVGTRIYAVTMPQLEKGSASYPALVFGLEARERRQTHNGPTSLVQSSFTLSCLGAGYLETKNLADQVRRAVNGNAAGLKALYDGDVKGVFVENENDEYVFDEVESLSLYHIPIALVIQHDEQE